MIDSDLKKQSNKLLTSLIASAGANVLIFLFLGFFVLIKKKNIEESGLEQIDPAMAAEQLSNLRVMAFFGFAIALIPAVICIFIVLKRTKILKQIKAQEEALLDELDVK